MRLAADIHCRSHHPFVLAVAVLTVVVGCLVGSPAGAAVDLIPARCAPVSVSATLDSVVPVKLSGQLCNPVGGPSQTVQLLLHGGGYNRTYWDLPYSSRIIPINMPPPSITVRTSELGVLALRQPSPRSRTECSDHGGEAAVDDLTRVANNSVYQFDAGRDVSNQSLCLAGPPHSICGVTLSQYSVASTLT